MTVTNMRTRLRGQGPLEVAGLGELWLVWSGAGLVRLALGPEARDAQPTDDPPRRPVPSKYADPLRRYFDGGQVDPARIPVDPQGSDFQKRVWSALRAVPRGAVRTYRGIAADVGAPRAMRAVGMANKQNRLPIVVPCHRIVQSGNRLGGYSGGLDVKRYLLALEGVRVEGDRVMRGQLALL